MSLNFELSRTKMESTAIMSLFFSSPRLHSLFFWRGTSLAVENLNDTELNSKRSCTRKLLQLLSFPCDQITAQPRICYMDHNNAKQNLNMTSILRLYSCNHSYYLIISIAFMSLSQSILHLFSACMCKAISLFDP